MKIIKSEKNFRVFEGNAEMLNSLPNDFYNVQFHPMVGFYLETTAAPIIKEKIYGTAQRKVEKTAKTFEKVGRNLGVLLSGAKGMGKTSFAKLLSLAMCKKIPVIFINQYLENIASFINSIEQEVVVVFDEFEKTFRKNSNNGPNQQNGSQQDELLTLFDGVFGGSKKLFIVTCNELSGISDFMLSRPGRFHYHYKFTKPEDAEIIEYLKDNLDEEVYEKFAQQVKEFAVKAEINFDCLRAICFELNNGNDLKDTLEDLNIYNNLNERKKYKVKIQLKSETFEQDCYINLFQPGEFHIDHNPKDDEDNINWRFFVPIAEIKEEQNSLLKGGYVVDPAKIKVEGWNYDEDKSVKFENTIIYVSLERVLERTNFTV